MRTATIMFTDVEGSTRWWETEPEQMSVALELHDGLVRDVVDRHGGEIFATGGDGFAVAFADAARAVSAALAVQAELAAAPWPDSVRLAVRIGVHTGSVEERGGDFFGPTLNTAARIMAAANGGQTVASAATAALVEPDEFTVVDLGHHRLKDLARPQQIFQVGGGAFAALRSLDAPRGNLPRANSSFVGRDDLVATIADTLAEARLVTITGVGGVGKTRLALEVAAALSDEVGDGSWMCELADAQTAGDVAEVVAGALGVRRQPPTPLDVTVGEFLRARDILVVLDNCEHILDAVADFAETVLERDGHARLLLTSREGLGIPGERIIAVPSLDEPAALELFEARLVDAGGQPLTAETRPTVARMCERLDRIPLALELAAARAAVMPIEALAHQLDERFDVLTGGRGRRRERHQTLSRTIDWSHDLLDESERRLFRSLAVFAGSFGFDAAVSVGEAGGLSEADVVEALAGLCRKSLLQPLVGPDGDRFRYLEMIRSYAEAKLEAAGELESAMAALTGWYLAWAARFKAFVFDLRSDEWVAEAAVEEPNVRRMLVWAMDHADADVICRFFAEFAPFTIWGGNRVAGWAVECLDEVDLDDHPQAFHVLGLAAWAAYEQLDHATVDVLAERALDSGRASGQVPVGAFIARGIALSVRGEFDEIMPLLDRTLDDAAGEHVLEESLMLGAAIYAAAPGVSLDRSEADLDRYARVLEHGALGKLGEVVHPFAAAGVELHRDPAEAERLLQLSADQHGITDTLAGEVIRQDLAQVATLRNNDAVAVTHGAHLVRVALANGRRNYMAIGGLLLCGPLVALGDAAFAAEVAGAVVEIRFFEHFAADMQAHILDRIRSALTVEDFDAHFQAGAAEDLSTITQQLVDRLATLEALTDRAR